MCRPVLSLNTEKSICTKLSRLENLNAIFQQGGVPAHYVRQFRNFMNYYFEVNCWEFAKL